MPGYSKSPGAKYTRHFMVTKLAVAFFVNYAQIEERLAGALRPAHLQAGQTVFIPGGAGGWVVSLLRAQRRNLELTKLLHLHEFHAMLVLTGVIPHRYEAERKEHV
jgi:hypothetical protein